jgi:adenine C2-methylase RlmN of 23S rRNA A2503 and tRNA A37
MGLRKHLSTAEIVEQAVFARRLFSDEFGSITNVVFMVSISFMITNETSYIFAI